MILQTESEEAIWLLQKCHVLSDRIFKETQKNGNKKWHTKMGRFHKTLGLKMNITRQTRIYQLIKVNVNLG